MTSQTVKHHLGNVKFPTGDNVIWKYSLKRSINEIEVPSGSEIVFFGAKVEPDAVLHLWVEFNSKVEVKEIWTVYVVGTGWKIPSGAMHVGSCVHSDLVWHCYVEFNYVRNLSGD